MLLSTPSDQEIKHATFSLSADSAPGPDGFTGIFFSVCWETVSRDVIDAVRDFFLQGLKISQALTSMQVIRERYVPMPTFCGEAGNFC